jgi:hypothetical protein
MFSRIIARLDEQDREARLREVAIRDRLDHQERSIRSQLDESEAASLAYREDIKERLSEIKTETAEIKTETKKTNGRVTALERWIDTSKAKVAGIVLAGTTIFSFLWWLIQRIW